ncbi:LysE family translocator [Amycolatopsis endophytica]|uniref:Threonine/homoserine/homoserine lactone efflux protein n=1 Tax=Amycolatopsis endophytica TaxID=860233 RepID=A0A853B095_9PSEU|nr:LysE family translocator [Amycolatopsis endophytica]NYI88146.1 threonine/homoserine/homoserine lactone efflux protein [Amycolatopsis endophytica]
MPVSALLTYTLVALVAVVTPGLDTMLMLRHTLLGGRRAGFRALTGINLGCLVWGTASIAGLTALLAASRIAYDVVRIGGAAYLLWLGGSALWRSFRHQVPDAEVIVEPGRGALRAGLVTNLLNPKVGVFYLSLLPQFLPAGSGQAAWGALLVFVHVALGWAWMSTVLLLANQARRFLMRTAVKRWLDRLTATVLIGLGVRIATESR